MKKNGCMVATVVYLYSYSFRVAIEIAACHETVLAKVRD
jgi:hypothetical protein